MSRIAVLTNFIAPYQKPVFEILARRHSAFRILISTPMEPNRPWRPEWDGLDVALQKTISWNRTWQHSAGFDDSSPVHFPLDTLRQLRQFRPDVIVSGEMGMRTLLAAAYRAFQPHSRLIVHADVSQITEQDRGFARSVLRRLLRNRADAFLVNGNSGAEYLLGLGVPAGKIFKTFYAADLGHFSSVEITRNRQSSHRLLYVGQLIERKGLHPFLTALTAFAQRNPNQSVDFVLAGDGPMRPVLERIQVPRNLRLEFVGNVSYAELPALYAASGILALPTLADTWAVVVNEAMACGLPVLGSRSSQAVEELVRDGENGWIFHPEPGNMLDAIARCFATPLPVLNTMRQCARESAVRMNPEAAACRIDRAISSCMKD